MTHPDGGPVAVVVAAAPGCPGPLTLAYTIDDDGVHVVCDRCQFDANLGFWAWLPQVHEAEAAHQRTED